MTGLGVVSPLGNDPDDLLAAARAGRSGIRRLDVPFADRLGDAVAGVSDFDGAHLAEPGRLRMMDRSATFALHAANRALAMSDGALDGLDGARAGTWMGIGMGGTLSMDEGYRTLYERGSDRIKPFTVLLGMHNAPAAWIALEHDLRGPSQTVSTACSSSTVALGEAFRAVADGRIEVAVAGGTEAPLSFGSLMAWQAMRTLATTDAEAPERSCRPFSANRTGMVLGEGAAVFVLEPRERAVARGAQVLGEVLGYGASTDIRHITNPSVEGQAAALRAALQDAGLSPDAVDAVNAHGTGTRANDATETAALREVLGARADAVPVSATKSMHGHLLGAAGALEAMLCVLAMRADVALPTLHLDRPDPDCDLDYVADVAREGVSVATMLSSSFAFGGSNAVLVLGRG